MADRTSNLRRSRVAATAAVAATYVYFLLFAQFAFLEQLKAHLDAKGVQAAMAAMGGMGLATSLVVAFAATVSRRALHRWFLAAGITALVSPAVSSPAALLVLAGAIGVATAGVTVSLAVLLPGWARGWLGRAAGVGTGIAYLLANLPGIFDGSVTRRAAVAALAAAVGLIALQFAAEEGRDAPEPSGPLRLWALLPGFLALVWLDSAVFAVVQQSALATDTWGSAQRSVLQGVVHAAAAVVAGVLLDRGRFASVLIGAFATFAVAFSWLDPGSAYLAIAGPIYAVGISLYSTALVVAPARAAEGRLAMRAGVLFGVAGWIGSALGVGMAQDLGYVPRWFVVVAGVAVGVVVLASTQARRRSALPEVVAVGAMLKGRESLVSRSRPETATEP
jgi:cytochrome c oxidase cbb3-type subunit 2